MTDIAGSDSTTKGLPRRAGLFFCIAAIAVLLTACDKSIRRLELTGETMGTGYSVQLVADIRNSDLEELGRAIEAELHRLDREIFSTYASGSEVSRFNSANVGSSIRVSGDLLALLQLGADVASASDGAFDLTVGPLVSLWGFGAGAGIQSRPSDESIRLAVERTGLDGIETGPGMMLVKLAPRQLDFSGIAKGYAVDRLAMIIEALGYHDFLVEVGGEVLASGSPEPGAGWQIAIEMPSGGPRQAAAVIDSRGERIAIAGSGSYRNFFETDGQRYAHEIDPRTGYPASNALLAVTVIHESAVLADAWATAFMVAGAEQAKTLAATDNIGVYTQSEDSGSVVTAYNAAFSHFLSE